MNKINEHYLCPRCSNIISACTNNCINKKCNFNWHDFYEDINALSKSKQRLLRLMLKGTLDKNLPKMIIFKYDYVKNLDNNIVEYILK